MTETRKNLRARLYCEDSLRDGEEITLSVAASHYLLSVLRARVGESVVLFNAVDGEWRGEMTSAAKKSAAVTLREKIRDPSPCPDLWLVFAPIKSGRIDFLVEKATELGAAALFPVNTDYTVASRVNHARLRMQAVEAAEQCGRCDIPELHPFRPLERLLSDWPPERTLIFCDESGCAAPIMTALAEIASNRLAVLIGPEGGFSPKEREHLKRQPYCVPVSLGSRILRAETAAAAALACVQNFRVAEVQLKPFDSLRATF